MAISDFTRGRTAGLASLPSTGLASLFALLRARRPFHGAESNFRMLVSGNRRWWDDGGRRSHVRRVRRAPLRKRPTKLPLGSFHSKHGRGAERTKGKVYLSEIHIVILTYYTGYVDTWK